MVRPPLRAFGLTLMIAALVAACGGEEAAPAAQPPAPPSPEGAARPEPTVAPTAPPAVEESAREEPTTEPAPEAPAAAAATEQAGWRQVRCALRSGEERYDGPCLFHSESGGSFTVKSTDPSGTLLGVSDISVTILEPGQAEVRGLTTEGINSRWGAATRSSTDRACWEGEGFAVCAR